MHDIYEQYTDDIATYSFNIPSDLMYDMCYPLRVKTLFFCFCSGYQKDKWILKRCLMNQSFSCTVDYCKVCRDREQSTQIF